MALLVLLAAACSSTSDQPVPEPSNDTATNEDPIDTSTDQDQQPDEPAPPGSDELAATWTEFLTTWFEQAAAEQPDPTAFENLTVDPDQTVEALTLQRGDGRLVTTEFEPWPRIDIASGRADIDDCAIAVQHPDGQPDSLATVTFGWEATALVTDEGWRIDTARQLELFCIAEELNDQLLSAYQAFRAAKEAAWDPPDPNHPDLARTMAGEQLEFIRDLLAEHARDGIVIREPAPIDNAVVFGVGIGQATVSDCTEQVEGYGAFDLDSGERLSDLIAPVDLGRLDAQSVELERGDDGSWRVVNQAASRDTDCVVGSTRYEVS